MKINKREGHEESKGQGSRENQVTCKIYIRKQKKKINEGIMEARVTVTRMGALQWQKRQILQREREQSIPGKFRRKCGRCEDWAPVVGARGVG